MVRFHMLRHFEDLRTIERMLVAGNLEDAKARAFLLTRPAVDPGMMPWTIEVTRVNDAAAALAKAPGIDEALRREARVAAACAACHLRVQKLPVFEPPRSPPADQPTRAARMARHQWAVDRLWEGMVGAADRPWRAGLDVLAGTPLPYAPTSDAPALASHLQELARDALAAQASESLDERTGRYSEMLVTCAACHATLKVSRSTARPR